MRKLFSWKKGKWCDRTAAVLWIAGFWILLSVCFDFYYDLNDDTAMKDILSGTYTGVPDGHNIQMLYPLGFLISALYRLLPLFPWYGIFLCTAQFAALYLSLCSLGKKLPEGKMKKVWLLFITAAAGSLLLYEFVFIQYTVTAGFLAAAALVRLFTAPDASEKGFFRYHIVTVLLIVTAFYLRTEMLLLLAPFLALGGLFRLLEECRMEKKKQDAGCGGADFRHIWKNYCILVLCTLILMGAGFLADRAAYGSSAWQEFRQFFDDRTSVYDFYGIPEYGKHQEFYEEIGLSEEEYTLLVNYNFDLEEKINAETMGKIAAYAGEHQETGMLRRLYLSAYTYVYRFLHGEEIVFDLLLLVSYFFLFRAALRERRAGLLLELGLLFSLKSMIWLFLLYRGRVPERITHPLYAIELILLFLLFLSDGKAIQWKKYEKSAILSMYLLLFVCIAVYHVQTVSESYRKREEINLPWQQLKTYCGEHPQQFYYLDVYSSVAYSEKLFSDISPKYRNFDLAGGWCSKSPLAEEKRKAAGFENAKDGLLSGAAYFVTDGRKMERSPEFLTAWYREKGEEIVLEEADRCGYFSIFRITKTQ